MLVPPTSLRCLLRLVIGGIAVTVAFTLLFSVNFQAPNRALHHSIRGEVIKPSPPQRNFTILIWRHGKRMLRRFLRSYGSVQHDPFAHCSVSNCRVRIDDEVGLPHSDAVMFHLHQTKGLDELPKTRLPHQRWIFFTDESPLHTFFANPRSRMKDFDGIFNWSMTYRSDSDIPVPYGRTVLQTTDSNVANYAQINDGFVAILGSNCGGRNHRWEFVRELQKHVPVDIFGGCGTLKCPGHFTKDCTPLARYKFYLAFENSNCREYVTEKLWWNAYAKNSVPVVMGAPREDYKRLCPPDSFIHVEDFANPAELGRYLLNLSRNETAYNSYFRWKRRYVVLNEHGYFGTPTAHLCRICEALNSGHKPKIYDNLEDFWNKKADCRSAKWTPPKS